MRALGRNLLDVIERARVHLLLRHAEKRGLLCRLTVDDYVVVNVELIVHIDYTYFDVTVSTLLLLIGTFHHTLDHLGRNLLGIGPWIEILEELLLMLIVEWMPIERC